MSKVLVYVGSGSGYVEVNLPSSATEPVAAQLQAVLANHACAESGGGTCNTEPNNYLTVTVLSDFTPTAAGSGKVHIEATCVFTNPDASAHTAGIAVVAVAHGAPAPTSLTGLCYPLTYANNAITLAAGATEIASLVFDFGAGGSFPALVPGTAYDIYLIAAASVNAEVTWGTHGTTLTAQEQV
jgi:hypothetical protein